MMIKFQNPIEPFNSMVRNGTAGPIISKIMDELKPESVYFTARDGCRGGVMIVDLNDASEIPKYAEPFFLNFNSTVEFHPCMSPGDLVKADLDTLGKKWG
ncbi:MAG: panthothenate synthetase [Saprospiraceae bacterium]|nr:panthothenate synthetase [Saprospiraceae bacterium]